MKIPSEGIQVLAALLEFYGSYTRQPICEYIRIALWAATVIHREPVDAVHQYKYLGHDVDEKQRFRSQNVPTASVFLEEAKLLWG